jgi:hypothetical protein
MLDGITHILLYCYILWCLCEIAPCQAGQQSRYQTVSFVQKQLVKYPYRLIKLKWINKTIGYNRAS